MNVPTDEQRRQATSLMALALLSCGRLSAAIEIAEKAGVELTPEQRSTGAYTALKCGWIEFETAVEVLASLGDVPALLAAGKSAQAAQRYSQALCAFSAAADADALASCGRAALTYGALASANSLFKAAGLEVTEEELVAAGDAAMKSRRYETAIELFRSAKATSRLRACGTRALQSGRFRPARIAFDAIGAKIPATKAIECGRKAMRDKRIDEAREAFIAALGTTEGTIAFGYAATEHNLVEIALEAFFAAKHFAGILAVGLAALEVNEHRLALLAFLEVGHKDGLIRVGREALKRGYFGSAARAFGAAGEVIPRAELMECGDLARQRGWLEIAFEAYREARDRERLIEIGNRAVEVGKMDLARLAFAGAVELP